MSDRVGTSVDLYALHATSSEGMRSVLHRLHGADAIIIEVRSIRSSQEAILHQFKLGNHNLLVMA